MVECVGYVFEVALAVVVVPSVRFRTRRRKKESSLFCFCTRGVGVESELCVCLRREFLCVYRSSMRCCFRLGWGVSITVAADVVPEVVVCV